MVALHVVCQVWWTLAYKPLKSTRHIIVIFFSKFGLTTYINIVNN